MRLLVNAVSNIQISKITGLLRYKILKNSFYELNKRNIKYAVIKGEPLSYYIYSCLGMRLSRDIDILVPKESIDEVRKVFFDNNNIIDMYGRKEWLYYMLCSHQCPALFIKEQGFTVELDINFDILWGNYEKRKIDINDFLSDTVEMDIYGVKIKTLSKIKTFLQVCLHCYKDLNSILLIQKRKKFDKNMFRDIYHMLRNNQNELTIDMVYNESIKYGIDEYIYYVLYYTEKIYLDPILKKYINALYSKENERILDTYGLTERERKKWKISFVDRLESEDLFSVIEKDLNESDMKNIKFNSRYF